jgi:hypothetical protein
MPVTRLRQINNDKKRIHTISSDDTKNMPKRFIRKQKRLPLDYDKYLGGRSYQLFKGAIVQQNITRLNNYLSAYTTQK